jgi:hypothetical protein
MAGRKFPHRHISKRALPLRGRDVNEVATYFKELQQFAAVQHSLMPNLLVKALPDGAVNSGQGNTERTVGENSSENVPQIKVNIDRNAKRKPGQVLKLHTTYEELTSKEGAKIGWVDRPKAKTKEEIQKALEDTRNSSPLNSPVFLRRYKRDIEGNLTNEIQTEIRVKELGRSIGSTMGRVSTQAFQAAGGIIDADGKLRCPPGTPNANQFTDLDMSNCMAVGVGTLVRGMRSIASKFNKLVQEGEELTKYGRVLTDMEREQIDTFQKTRSAVTSAEHVANVARAHTDTLVQAIRAAGIDFDDSVGGGSFDLVMAWRNEFPDTPEGERQFFNFLFGDHFADNQSNNSPLVKGGILGDALGADGVGFQWEGDTSPESIKQNLQRYDTLMREKLTTFLPKEAQDALRDPNASPELRLAAQQLLDRVRERHHLAQRESIGTSLVFKKKYPEAFERMGGLRAFTEADIGVNETLWSAEGSTRPDLDGTNDLISTVSFNAMGVAISSMYGNADSLQNLSDGSWVIDVGNTSSEAERIAKTVQALEQITDAMQFAELVSETTYANQTSSARIAAAFGNDAVIGRSRHIMWHELGHVLQYHAFQQNVLDFHAKHGFFPIVTDQGILELTDPPSLWTSGQMALALQTIHQSAIGMDFPPGGMKTFENSLANLFAGKYYLDKLGDARKAELAGDFNAAYAEMRIALTEGSTEVFAQREMGILEGAVIDDAIRWMLPETQTYKTVASIPYEIPPERPSTEIVPSSAPDIPTSTGLARGGTGVVNVFNGPVINGPVNVTIINHGSGVASEMDTPDSTVDVPKFDETGAMQAVEIAWSDISGHIYMDEDTQWSPTQVHNIEIEQNPDEVRRIVDATFALGPEHGGPDPEDKLGAIRQKKDAYWKMPPEVLDARYEKLDSEFTRLRDKSMDEPLTADEQARMWLAMKGMRQILDVNTRKSKMSEEDIAKYEARGFDPQPGKYMRKVDSISKPQQQRFRQYAIDKRKARGFEDIVEVDDDELTHWSREIGHHAADAPGGKDGFDGSGRTYDPANIRNSRVMSIKEKRKRSPEYQPSEDEIKNATLAVDPEIVGQRKIDEIAQRATPAEKAVLQASDSIDSSPIVTSISEHASSRSASELTRLVDQSAQTRINQRAGAPVDSSKPALLDEQITEQFLPLLDIIDKSLTDEDMSVVMSFELNESLQPGHIIEHGGPVRGLLVPSEASDNFKYSSPTGSTRAVVILPKGSRAMHAKNAHNGDADGVLLPPGSLEVVNVDPDGTLYLMPSGQKTANEIIDDSIKAFESIEADPGSPVAGEARRIKEVLQAERLKRGVPAREVRGQSGDMTVSAKADLRAESISRGFAKTGSDFFGTSEVLQPETRPQIGMLVRNNPYEDALIRDESINAAINMIKNELSRIQQSPQWQEFINNGEIPQDILDTIKDTPADELLGTIDNTIFRFHEGFDDRPRMMVDIDRFGELLDTGKLSNQVELKPDSISAKLQKRFESVHGLTDNVPDGSRSHFGFLRHSASEKEVQDYLDELPQDGMIREARYFSEADGINQLGDLRSGGNNIELVLRPETAKRTAYSKGNPMDSSVVPTPLLSTNRSQVRSAHISNPDSYESEPEFSRQLIDTLITARSGNMTGHGSGISRSARSSSSRADAPTYEAVIGGGINISDIEGIKVDARHLQTQPLSADDLGGRDGLKKLLSDAGVTGDLDTKLDALLNGTWIDDLSEDTQGLYETFYRMRVHKAAVAHVEKMKSHYGDSIDVIVTNPEGIDIRTIDSFTDLPHIDKGADDATKLRERLRYDIYGARMRQLDNSAVRERYRETGQLLTTPGPGVYASPDELTPDTPALPSSPVVRKPVPRGGLEPFFGKRNTKGRYVIIDNNSPGWDEPGAFYVEFDPDTNDLHLISKDTGEIETIHGVDPIEVVQLSQGIDDDGGFDTIKNSVERIRTRYPDREVTSGGKRQAIQDRSRSSRIISAEQSTGRDLQRMSQGRPLADMSDEELHAAWSDNAPYIPSGGTIGMSGPIEDRKLDKRAEIYAEMRKRGIKPKGPVPAEIKFREELRRDFILPPDLGPQKPRMSGSRSSRSRGMGNQRQSNVQKIFTDASSLGRADDPTGGLHALDDAELLARFNAERSGVISVSDGTDIYRVNDIESAAALIAAGYHVQLGEGARPEQLVEASANLQKQIDAVIPDLRNKLGRDDASFGTIDTCRLYKSGTNVFCEGGLGTFREDMPQLSGRASGDDALVVGAMKGGVVKTKWSGGRRKQDGTLEKLTPEESARFDELKARHASPGKDGNLSADELEEFYSMVDWNDTEADLTPAFKDFVRRVTGREDAIVTTEGILPSSLSASQGQIQMAKTGGMVISMRNHDYSFRRYMQDNHPDVSYGSNEYYNFRDSWLYKGTLPDGTPLSMTMYNVDGELIDKDGKVLPTGSAPFTTKGKPWYTDGSIISTSDGFVVDGHHRWASFMAYNEGKPEREQLRITSEVMDMPIDDALSIGKVVQDHWGIKPAVLGRETYFKGDGVNASAIDGKRFAEEMSIVEAERAARMKQARKLYFQKEGFGLTESRIGQMARGRVRVSEGGSSRSSRSIIGRNGTNVDTTPIAKRNTRDLFEDIVSLGDHSNSESGLHKLSDDELASRFSASRTDLVAASDGLPVYRVDDVDSAAALLAAGYHVELGDNAKPKKLVRASNKLQKEIDKIIPELRKKYGRDDAGFGTIDTCRLYKAGTNIFCKGGLGTLREDMPQLSGRAKGDNVLVVGAMKAGRVKTDWKPGHRSPDGSLRKLTPDEQKRFDELKARHASTKNGVFNPGDLTDAEKSEFYSLVDWNDTEADLMTEFREYVKSVTGRDNVISTKLRQDPSKYNASQGQVQMGKTAGMVISMENHDYSFSKWMKETHPDIDHASDEFFRWRAAWLYGEDAPDGTKFQIPLYDVDGTPLDAGGDPFRDADGNIIKDAKPGVISQPWFTKGSIIVTKDGFVVDGHHRWASFLAYNEDLDSRAKLELNVEEMDMPIDEALSIGKVMQDHWGIKPAVLGRETFFEGDGANAPDLSADDIEASKTQLINEATSRMPSARDLYIQKEGFGLTESRVGKQPRGKVRVSREAVGSSRSSRSISNDRQLARISESLPPKPSSRSARSNNPTAQRDRLFNPYFGRTAGDKRPKKPGKISTEVQKRDYLTEMAAHIIRVTDINETMRTNSYRRSTSLDERVTNNDLVIKDMIDEFYEVANSLNPESRKQAQSIIDSLENSNYGKNMAQSSGALIDLNRRINLPRSSRSSRSTPNDVRSPADLGGSSPRSFVDEYPMMSRIGINPRPSSEEEDSLFSRQEAEDLLNGATKKELREAEQIASDAVKEIEDRREKLLDSIGEELGSRQVLVDLMDFEKPVPETWKNLTKQRREEISKLLNDMNQFELEKHNEAKSRILAIRQAGRNARQRGIDNARSSSRSARTEAIKRSVPLDRVGNDLAEAFANRGAAGVMSKLRSLAKNDSSKWAIDYAVERGYISKSQGATLKKLAQGIIKRVILPGLESRNKAKKQRPSVKRPRK